MKLTDTKLLGTKSFFLPLLSQAQVKSSHHQMCFLIKYSSSWPDILG